MTEMSIFEAKCTECGCSFFHPSFGDIAYGHAVLCTLDGKAFATVDAFDEFSQKVSTFAASKSPGSFWPLMASLADPIDGVPLDHRLRCPHCGSANLQSWSGDRSGEMTVPPASFESAKKLSPDALASLIEAHEAELAGGDKEAT